MRTATISVAVTRTLQKQNNYFIEAVFLKAKTYLTV